ncbi:hypothetical protein [Shewanella algae]|uniref:hypothetical protein n=1 Tax=Shewanella algae TaxID=38313 RepID=UPI000D14F828|nr:hypothetical protein [Shewanella algae]PST68873.1 hypothetical protein AYI77_01890 [Shewanella algae]
MFNLIFDSSSVEVGLIEVDTDPSAERIIAIDRVSGQLLFAVNRPPSGIVKQIVPVKYAFRNQIIVGIFDDSEQYAAKTVDGAQATRHFAPDIDMSQ